VQLSVFLPENLIIIARISKIKPGFDLIDDRENAETVFAMNLNIRSITQCKGCLRKKNKTMMEKPENLKAYFLPRISKGWKFPTVLSINIH
jgi:hypothetical protein